MICPGDFNTREASLDRDILIGHDRRFHARRERTSWDSGAAGCHSLSARKLTSAQNYQGKNEDSCVKCES